MRTPDQLKIVFFGTPEFAVESLQAIVNAGYNVKAVVTAPDKPAGRGMQLHQSDVKVAALKNNLPVLQPVSLKDPVFVDQLRKIDADLFVIIAFRMLPEVVWNMPPMGTFNLHASLLPDYRGAAPINWAVINGDSETGVTTFFLKHEIDTGDVILQKRVGIGPDQNVGELYEELMKVGAELTLKTLKDICEDKVHTASQDSLAVISQQRPAPKITKDTSRIRWDKPASEIHNLVRGMSPYPGAWTELMAGGSKKILKIYKTAKVDCEKQIGAFGEITVKDGRMYVSAKDSVIEILELQLQGKKRMKTAEYLLGAKLEGAVLK